MMSTFPSDRVILRAMSRMLPELEKRYGGDRECTIGQVSRTFRDLRISKNVYPYLCAACLDLKALPVVRAATPAVHWTEVENRARRLLAEHDRNSIKYIDHFHESGIGI